MLKRIYIDNFRCFVNFELHLEKASLLMGPNGSGKSSIFNVLEIIQRLVSEGEKIPDLFKNESLTRWRADSLLQKVELDVSGNQGTYRYSLEVEHSSNRHVTRIRNESLFLMRSRFTVSESKLMKPERPSARGISIMTTRTIPELSCLLTGHVQVFISSRRDMITKNLYGSETIWNSSSSPVLIRMSCLRKPVSPGHVRHGICQIMRIGSIILPMNTAGK